ncbi:MAG: hypothetical protein SOI38_05360 [Eggerthellaceae bacterium]|jgi:hypothetical protein
MAGSCGAFCSFCGKCGRRVTKVFDATKIPTIAPPGTPAGVFDKHAESTAEPEGEPAGMPKDASDEAPNDLDGAHLTGGPDTQADAESDGEFGASGDRFAASSGKPVASDDESNE